MPGFPHSPDFQLAGTAPANRNSPPSASQGSVNPGHPSATEGRASAARVKRVGKKSQSYLGQEIARRIGLPVGARYSMGCRRARSGGSGQCARFRLHSALRLFPGVKLFLQDRNIAQIGLEADVKEIADHGHQANHVIGGGIGDHAGNMPFADPHPMTPPDDPGGGRRHQRIANARDQTDERVQTETDRRARQDEPAVERSGQPVL